MMRILVVGCGFIASELKRLVDIDCAPRGRFPVDGYDIVINLAGESLLGVWTPAKRTRIRESRIGTTRALVDAIASAKHKPRLLINASAVGIYGRGGGRGSAERYGEGFLARTAQEWEQEAHKAQIPVAIVRFGVVLGEKGMLAFIDPLVRKGLGAVPGRRDAIVPWISSEDCARAIMHVMQRGEGTYDLVAPEVTCMGDLMDAYARKVGGKIRVCVPRWMLHLSGNAELFSSIEVRPSRLSKEGFVFAHPTLEEVMRRGRLPHGS